MLQFTAKHYRTRSWEITECYRTLQNTTWHYRPRNQNSHWHCVKLRHSVSMKNKKFTHVDIHVVDLTGSKSHVHFFMDKCQYGEASNKWQAKICGEISPQSKAPLYSEIVCFHLIDQNMMVWPSNWTLNGAVAGQHGSLLHRSWGQHQSCPGLFEVRQRFCYNLINTSALFVFFRLFVFVCLSFLSFFIS